MRFKKLSDAGPRMYALIFEKNEEFMAGMLAFAKEHGIAGARFTGIGALQRARLGYFDRDRKDYRPIPIEEQVEVLSLLGDIALKDGEPKLHAHIVVGKSDGAACGGHVVEGHVWPTLEIVLTETFAPLKRRFDPETGLALIDPELA
jgi:predicted DNA-binding protein with PD1-like motif